MEQVKYVAFIKSTCGTEGDAIDEVIRQTGWTSFNVEILPDQIIDTSSWSCIPTITKGNLRITRTKPTKE